MSEKTAIRSSVGVYNPLLHHHYDMSGFFIKPIAGGYDQMSTNAYQQGVEDGKKDMEVELIKRGKALYQLAFQKIDFALKALVDNADKNKISIIEIHVKVDNWDCAESVILVKLEDYLNDHIDKLYSAAQELSEKVNNENFHWDYSITYHSEDINKEKLISDGFQYLYEHTPNTRPA